MQRILLSLLAELALPTAVHAGISYKLHKKCLEARDYKGCVNTNKNLLRGLFFLVDQPVRSSNLFLRSFTYLFFYINKSKLILVISRSMKTKKNMRKIKEMLLIDF